MIYNKDFFSQIIILAVWNKGIIIPGRDPSVFRKDLCGAIMEFSQHGTSIDGGTGWEIDHIFPKALGGSDALTNLQPLQWQNNREKGDGLFLKCKVSAA